MRLGRDKRLEIGMSERDRSGIQGKLDILELNGALRHVLGESYVCLRIRS